MGEDGLTPAMRLVMHFWSRRTKAEIAQEEDALQVQKQQKNKQISDWVAQIPKLVIWKLYAQLVLSFNYLDFWITFSLSALGGSLANYFSISL